MLDRTQTASRSEIRGETTSDWTTTGHKGVDVPLTAEDPGSGRLAGNYENTGVYNGMAGALGVARR